MTTAAELNDRYGRGRSHRGWWIGVGIVSVTVVIAASWLTFARASLDVDFDDTSFAIVDEHSATAGFQITPPRGQAVACVVEALDEDFGVVGWKVVEFDATENASIRASETVATVAEASTVFVNSCWVP